MCNFCRRRARSLSAACSVWLKGAPGGGMTSRCDLEIADSVDIGQTPKKIFFRRVGGMFYRYGFNSRQIADQPGRPFKHCIVGQHLMGVMPEPLVFALSHAGNVQLTNSIWI